jgi:hypothetical protein
MNRQIVWSVRSQKLKFLSSLSKKIDNQLLKKFIGNTRCFVFAFNVLPLVCYVGHIPFTSTATFTPDWLVRKDLKVTVAAQDADAYSARQMAPSKRSDVCENVSGIFIGLSRVKMNLFHLGSPT